MLVVLSIILVLPLLILTKIGIDYMIFNYRLKKYGVDEFIISYKKDGAIKIGRWFNQ